MQPPPTRYKIVERGRRLEVIDTRTGQPVSPSVPLPLAGDRRADPLRPSGDLTGITNPSGRNRAQTESAGVDPDTFVTKRWFDDKGPRKIRLNYATRARLSQLRFGLAIGIALLVVLSFWFWPLAILLVVAPASGPKLRAQLRTASTNWIDGLDQAA